MGASWVGAGAVAQADPSGQLLMDVVPGPPTGEYMIVDPKFQPQLGQSFSLSEPVTVTDISILPEGIAYAKKLEFLTSSYDRRHFVYTHGGQVVQANVLLRIWRTRDGSAFPTFTHPTEYQTLNAFDVSSTGYEQVYEHQYATQYTTGKPFVLALDPPVSLQPGNYLIGWGFTFPDKRIFGANFNSVSSGYSTRFLAYFFPAKPWREAQCSAPPVPDRSQPGTMAYVADQWATPGGVAPTGPFPGTIGMTTWFRPSSGKFNLDNCPGAWADGSHGNGGGSGRGGGTLPMDLNVQIFGTRP